jgi:hypothetical protein
MNDIGDPGNIMADKMSTTGNGWQDIYRRVMGTGHEESNP